MCVLSFCRATFLVFLLIASNYAVLYQHSIEASADTPPGTKNGVNMSSRDLRDGGREIVAVGEGILSNRAASLPTAQSTLRKGQALERLDILSTESDFVITGEYSLLYANEDLSEWGTVTAAVNITVEYFDENDVRVWFVVLYGEAIEGFYFRVNNKICRHTCVAVMPHLQDADQLQLNFVGDSGNTVTMARGENNTTLFYYSDCQQPLEDVTCRSKPGLPFCICNGYTGTCAEDGKLLTGKDCSTAISTSSYEGSSTTPRISASTAAPHNRTTAAMTSTPTLATTKTAKSVATETATAPFEPSAFTTVCITVSTSGTMDSTPFDTKSPNTTSSAGLTSTKSGKPTVLLRTSSAAPNSSSSKRDGTPSALTTIPLCWNIPTKSTPPTETTKVSPSNTATSPSTVTLRSTTTSFYTSRTTTKNDSSDTTTRGETTSIYPNTSSMETVTTTPTLATWTTPSTDDLKELSEKEVDLKNVSKVLNETLQYSEQRTELKADQIEEITTILEKCANLSGIQPEDSRKVLLNIDCILSADVSQIKASGNSSQRLLELLPTLVQNTNASSFDFLEGENLGFTATAFDCSSSEDTLGLVDNGRSFDLLKGPIPGKDDQNSIVMSTANICNIGLRASHMFMTIYRNRKLFMGPKQYNTYNATRTIAQRSALPRAHEWRSQTDEEIPPSSACARQLAPVDTAPVMSGTLVNDAKVATTSSSEKEIAVLKFGLTQILHPLHGHFQVTWWDTELLEWSTENQCDIAIVDRTVVAQCNHLTDFALIVDAALNDPNVCEKGLIALGYSVNVLSILSLLFVTIINACAYWSVAVRSRTHMFLRGYAPPQRDFVSLSHKISMLLFYLLFTIFSDQSVSGKACNLFASLSYMLLMSSVLLTIFQALRLIASITISGKYASLILAPPTAVTISLILPFTASLLLLILTNFFHRGDCFCWVRPDYIVYAVIIPTSVVILNAVVCTIIMCRKLFGNGGWSGAVRHHRIRTASRIGAVFVMQISLGMPWALQYLTLYSPSATIWHYVFTIVMGSQGTVLAVLFFFKRRQSTSFYRRSVVTRLTNVESSSDIT